MIWGRFLLLLSGFYLSSCTWTFPQHWVDVRFAAIVALRLTGSGSFLPTRSPGCICPGAVLRMESCSRSATGLAEGEACEPAAFRIAHPPTSLRLPLRMWLTFSENMRLDEGGFP